MPAVAPKPLPSFTNPPLIEVVCGVLFRQIEALLVPHFGLLWADKYRRDYPNVREVEPVAPTIERFGDPSAEESRTVEFITLPRVWFVEERENSIIQLQRDRFHHNWKKVGPEDEYPRYGRVTGQFFERLEQFEDFLRAHNLPAIDPRQYELTYINHVYQGEGWETLADVGRVFPDFAWRSIPRKGVPAPTGLAWLTTLDSPDRECRLRVTITHRIRRTDKRPLLALELTARGFGGEPSTQGMRRWFDRAHEFLVHTFVDMTSSAVREKVWGEVR